VLGVNSAIAAFYYLRLAFTPFLEKRDEFAESMELSPYPSRRVGALVSGLCVVVLAVGASGLMEGSAWGGRSGAVISSDVARDQVLSFPVEQLVEDDHGVSAR
jgi:hypothetical protein